MHKFEKLEVWQLAIEYTTFVMLLLRNCLGTKSII